MTAVVFDAGIIDGLPASNNCIGHAMSIVNRGNSKNWYIHFQFNGQAYIRSCRTTNKKIAEQMEIEWKAKLHSQQYLRISYMDVVLGKWSCPKPAIGNFHSDQLFRSQHSSLCALHRAGSICSVEQSLLSGTIGCKS